MLRPAIAALALLNACSPAQLPETDVPHTLLLCPTAEPSATVTTDACVLPSALAYEGFDPAFGPIFTIDDVSPMFDDETVLASHWNEIGQLCPWRVTCDQTAVAGLWGCVAVRACAAPESESAPE